MRYSTGAILGALLGFSLVALAGAIWGGVHQVAPCYGGAASRPVADRILAGAMFGMLGFGTFFGLPTAGGGAIEGFVTALIRENRRCGR